ncbi:unnamed protein product, partial [marine sediment metagenome]
EPPWQFLSYSADPSLTPEELKSYSKHDDNKHAKRWVVIKPLKRGVYENEVRAIDLIHRMLAAKIGGADAIFVPNPFSTERGLMNDDGTPGELLLPWRTTALAISGTEHLGSIRLPGGSKNEVFARDGEAVMVIWSDQPGEEVIYLGEDARLVDIWGHETKLVTKDAKKDPRQVIPVGPMPVFIRGVNEPITRMRMAFKFEETKVPSIFGEAHHNSFEMQNFFKRGVNVRVTMNTSNVWEITPRLVKT